jgi:OFA family oxalate/formate antiporter-like MFS transporter
MSRDGGRRGWGEFRKGWRVLFAGTIGVACGASPLPYNVIGFIVAPLQSEFGWSITQIVAGITVTGVTSALLAPLFGLLADKYGVRNVTLLSVLAFGILFAAMSLAGPTLASYYWLWFALGLVGIGSTPVTWSRGVNLWFFQHRGLALGILLLGTSLAAMVVPRLAVFFIENYGWRRMFLLLACLPLFFSLPLAVAWLREPKPEEQPPGITNDRGVVTGVTLGTALRDYRFWLIWVSVVIVALTFGGAFVNMPTILNDSGIDAGGAATVMGILGLGIFTGRIVTGALLDRLWAGYVGFPLLCLPALSSYILIGDQVSMPLAITAGYLIGFAAGAESDLIAYLAGRYFGMAHYGKIYGMLYMPFGLASAISPMIYAFVRESTGSYNAILQIAIFAYFLGGGLLLCLGRYPTLTAPDERAEEKDMASLRRGRA